MIHGLSLLNQNVSLDRHDVWLYVTAYELRRSESATLNSEIKQEVLGMSDINIGWYALNLYSKANSYAIQW